MSRDKRPGPPPPCSLLAQILVALALRTGRLAAACAAFARDTVHALRGAAEGQRKGALAVKGELQRR